MLGKLKSELERLLLLKNMRVKYPPVFISGCPRSGTTISFQHLVNNYKCSYFSNYEKYNPKSPVLSSLIYRACNNYQTNSESTYGKIQGKSSPSDGWSIFHRWFPYYYGDAPVKELNGLKRTIGWVEWLYGLPFIVKNNASSLRIVSLAKAFPDALFVHVERDFYENIRSLVEGLSKNHIPLQQMWGTGPGSQFVDYKFKNDIEKSVFQYEFIAAYIRRVELEFDDIRVCRVSYLDVLETKGKILGEILYRGYKGKLEERGEEVEPVEFRKSRRGLDPILIQAADVCRTEMRMLAIKTLNKIPFE